MDPATADALRNIILGVLGNGITSLIAATGRDVKSTLLAEKGRKRSKQQQETLQGLLKTAVNILAEDIEWEGAPGFETVCLFLTSPDSEAIVRQIYSAQYLEEFHNLDLIRHEFLIAFSNYTGLGTEYLKSSAFYLFNKLVESCNSFLDTATDKGFLSAFDAKSQMRYLVLRDEIATIQRNLDFLNKQDKLNIDDIFDFTKEYRNQVEAREGYVRPPFFDSARKYHIDEIYVSPSFETHQQGKDVSSVISLESLLSETYRLVILGNPGGGKSTFTQKLCHDLSVHYDDRLISGRKLTPIRVVLREYGSEKNLSNCSILEFIETIAKSYYQIKSPAGAFEYLLLNGHVIVIFDGLDELLDTSYRREISDDVETFCVRYPSAPIIVTSREVGYDQAPLDERRFRVARLAPFEDEQIKEYLNKWFAIGTDLPKEQQTKKIDSFLQESNLVPDLRSNPLMLALMCNIYQGENYIPRNRPDIYRKCAEMLFERWDKSRGIRVDLPLEAHIRPAMMYLAYWIYSDQTLQTGVTEYSLINKATDYLYPRRFEDRDEAESAARAFIDFCRGRAWVFTDTGTTSKGERIYQFTHRTFLEYFTASHLVRIYPTPQNLVDALFPKIVKNEWDVAAQLAFQIQFNNIEGAGDDILASLLGYTKNLSEEEKWSILSFVARCLNFIVPSPKVTRDIASACINA